MKIDQKTNRSHYLKQAQRVIKDFIEKSGYDYQIEREVIVATKTSTPTVMKLKKGKYQD